LIVLEAVAELVVLSRFELLVAVVLEGRGLDPILPDADDEDEINEVSVTEAVWGDAEVLAVANAAEVFEDVIESKDDADALVVDFAVAKVDAVSTFVVETALDGVAFILNAAEAVTKGEVVPVTTNDAVVLTDNVDVPIELEDKEVDTVTDTDDD
jgi:hypothetical protein